MTEVVRVEHLFKVKVLTDTAHTIDQGFYLMVSHQEARAGQLGDRKTDRRCTIPGPARLPVKKGVMMTKSRVTKSEWEFRRTDNMKCDIFMMTDADNQAFKAQL